jgi:hypothetical protein
MILQKFAIKNLSKLAKGNWVISAISWQDVTFDEIMMISLVLDHHTVFYNNKSLKQQSMDKHVAPLGQIFLLDVAWLAEKQQIPIIYS